MALLTPSAPRHPDSGGRCADRLRPARSTPPHAGMVDRGVRMIQVSPAQGQAGSRVCVAPCAGSRGPGSDRPGRLVWSGCLPGMGGSSSSSSRVAFTGLCWHTGSSNPNGIGRAIAGGAGRVGSWPNRLLRSLQGCAGQPARTTGRLVPPRSGRDQPGPAGRARSIGLA